MKILLDFLILILLYIFIFYKKWKAKGREKLFVNTLMYIYISFVLYFTLMPIISSIPFIFNHPYVFFRNLTPFSDAIARRGDFIRQIVLNVIMMIPFGFLLPLINKKYSFIKVALYTFLFSLCIELLQPLINGFRSSDITDIITNTTGGITGYILYLVFKPVTIRLLNKLQVYKLN